MVFALNSCCRVVCIPLIAFSDLEAILVCETAHFMHGLLTGGTKSIFADYGDRLTVTGNFICTLHFTHENIEAKPTEDALWYIQMCLL